MIDVSLQTDRLVLRPPNLDDVADITAACQDPTIAEWTTIPSPYSIEDGQAFVTEFAQRGWESGTSATWAIHADGRLVGMIGLSIESGSGDLGYWLTPEARGKGYSTEATEEVIRYAFSADGLNLPRLSWSAYAGNTASVAVARRAGFTLHGPIRGHIVHRQERRDSWLGTLYRNESGSGC